MSGKSIYIVGRYINRFPLTFGKTSHLEHLYDARLNLENQNILYKANTQNYYFIFSTSRNTFMPFTIKINSFVHPQLFYITLHTIPPPVLELFISFSFLTLPAFELYLPIIQIITVFISYNGFTFCADYLAMGNRNFFSTCSTLNIPWNLCIHSSRYEISNYLLR